MNSERAERLRYFGFAGFVGLLLLLNVTGYFTTIFGIDTAAIITVLAGYRIFFNSIAALFEKEISADLAICIAVIAALVTGQYLEGAEAMFIMLVAAGWVGEFVERHPTVKMLALSFLLLIGTALIADALHFHIPRGYLYFAVAFSGMVEALNQYVAHSSLRASAEPHEWRPAADTMVHDVVGNRRE